MRQRHDCAPESAEQTVRDIRRAIRLLRLRYDQVRYQRSDRAPQPRARQLQTVTYFLGSPSWDALESVSM
jgi:hypothetical protein